MPRKSLKTAHVLSLLSGEDQGTEKESEASGQEQSEPAQSEKAASNKTAPNHSSEDTGGGSDGQVSPAENPVASPTSVPPVEPQTAQQISGPAQPTPLQTPVTAVPFAPNGTVAGQPIQTYTGAPIPQSVQLIVTHTTQDPMPASLQDTPRPAAAEEEEPSVSSISVIDTGRREEDEAAQLIKQKLIEETEELLGDKQEEPPEEPKFRYINVMEYVIKNRVVDYMDQMGMCTCDRCVADTTALTLTNLPAKYIVTDSVAVAPLLSFYSNKYSCQALIELTKSCLIVKKHPKH